MTDIIKNNTHQSVHELTQEQLGGGTPLNPSARSTVENIYKSGVLERSDGGKVDVDAERVGLIVQNPDGSKIIVRMDEYNGQSLTSSMKQMQNEVSSSGITGIPDAIKKASKDGLLASTEDLRKEVFEAYERIAATESGTAMFTQNAKYFNEVSWKDTKESEASPTEGKFAGNMRERSPAQQDAVIIHQHDQMQDAEYQNLIKDQGHSKANMSQDESNRQATTLKEQIADRTPDEQAKILAIVEKQSNTQPSISQNEPSLG